ncbi:MAG: hypothetical protein HYU64_03435 [Armatimonadetes bacterium]|nr:hypothetical protein [Armatimonadota bacterium]
MLQEIQEKDCLGRDNTTLFTFPKKVDQNLLRSLELFGPISVNSLFPLPLVKQEIPRGFALIGAIGLSEVRVTYHKDGRNKYQSLLRDCFHTWAFQQNTHTIDGKGG